MWFEPNEVWEIRGADITLSPVYTAAKGLISAERGLSLRFPRFLRRRADKTPNEASKPQQLANLYLEQNESSKISRGTNASMNIEGGSPDSSGVHNDRIDSEAD